MSGSQAFDRSREQNLSTDAQSAPAEAHEFGSNAVGQEQVAAGAGDPPPSDTELIDLLMADATIGAGVRDWQARQARSMADQAMEWAARDAEWAAEDPSFEGETRTSGARFVNPSPFQVGPQTAAAAGLGEGVVLQVDVDEWRMEYMALDAGLVWTYVRAYVGGDYQFTLAGEASSARRASWVEFGSDVFETRLFPGGKVVGQPDVTWKNHAAQDTGGSDEGADQETGNPVLDGKLGEQLGIPQPEKGDGSGKHGSEEAGLKDYAVHTMWMHAATAAEAGGMTNAARHMRHYLANSGSLLIVNPELALRDDPSYQETLDRLIERQFAYAYDFISGSPDEAEQWDFETPKTADHAFNPGNNRDWYYAVGGHTTWADGWYTYEPAGDGTGLITMELDLYLYDRYNWDRGKSVQLFDDTILEGTPIDITVTDEELGRLHQRGLAKEYEVYGDTHRTVRQRYVGQKGDTDLEVGRDRELRHNQGGRSDPGREVC